MANNERIVIPKPHVTVKQLVQEVTIVTSIVGFTKRVFIDGVEQSNIDTIDWEYYVVMTSIQFMYVKSVDVINEYLDKICHLSSCEIFVEFALFPVDWRSVLSCRKVKSIEMCKVRMQEKLLFRDILFLYRHITHLKLNLAASEVAVPTTVSDWLNNWERSSLIRHFELHNVPLDISLGGIYQFRWNKCSANAYVHLYISTTKARQPTNQESVQRKWEIFLRMRRLTPETAGFMISYEPEFFVDDVKQYDKLIQYAAQQEKCETYIDVINDFLVNTDVL